MRELRNQTPEGEGLHAMRTALDDVHDRLHAGRFGSSAHACDPFFAAP